ncbi:MAG: phosphoribosylpyrophosphate synthetase, partial [Gammaproteobacteria bacterium]
MLLLSFDHYQAPAKKIAKELGIPFSLINTHKFPDGESLVQLPEPLPEKIIFCQTFDFPNDKLIEIFIAAQAARQQGVKDITLIAPYLCYMRQDKAFQPGQAVSQKIIGPFLADIFDHIITVDPHLHRIKTLKEAMPTQTAVALTAAQELGNFVKNRFQDAVFVGPDEESEQWVSVVAQPGGNDFLVASK